MADNVETITANEVQRLLSWDAQGTDSREHKSHRASPERHATRILAALSEAGYVVVTPYQKVIVASEGSNDEYQLVPTSQIDVYQQTIKQLKVRLG